MTHLNLKFQGKEVIDIPQKKEAYVKVTIYESTGIFENKCVLPDNTSGIYAKTGEGTFFKDMGVLNIIQPSSAYEGKTRYIPLSYNGRGHSGMSAWGLNSQNINNVKVLIGRDKTNKVAIPVYMGYNANAVADPEIEQQLIEIGFSEADAQIIAKGMFYVINVGVYLMFADYVKDVFLIDLAVNGEEQGAYKAAFWGTYGSRYSEVSAATNSGSKAAFTGVPVIENVAKAYGAGNVRPILTVRIKPEENLLGIDSMTTPEHVYLKTTVMPINSSVSDNDEYFATTPDETVLAELLAMGVKLAYANILAKGVLVYVNMNSNKCGAALCFSDTMPVNGNSPYEFPFDFQLCVGDYNYLKEREEG